MVSLMYNSMHKVYSLLELQYIEVSKMMQVNLNNPAEIRNAGFNALREALGPIGMVRFIQQFDTGYGDYTKEKQESPDISHEEAVAMMMQRRKK